MYISEGPKVLGGFHVKGKKTFFASMVYLFPDWILRSSGFIKSISFHSLGKTSLLSDSLCVAFWRYVGYDKYQFRRSYCFANGHEGFNVRFFC